VEFTKEKHESIIKEMADGKCTLLIDTAGMRQLFTKVDAEKFSQKFNLPASKAIALITFLPFLEGIILLFSAVIMVFAFHWYAFVLVPLFILISLIHKSLASFGRQRILPALIFLVICCSFAWFAGSVDFWIRIFAVSAGVLQFVTRFLYWFTARVSFNFVEKSHEFFNMAIELKLLSIHPPAHEDS
jgi:hypothetical protein